MEALTYKEMISRNYSNLLCLDGQGASEFAFRRPEAQRCARWMSAPIYAFKIYLLHNRLELDATLLRGSAILRQFSMLLTAFNVP